ncbi:amidase domain-containing protein [Candidatus Soleaferrea massiliensis]|uniref:amidase domain-containing protein n=1 Tax=Candidatus Soleaferrea massiliensis TaxID=1470354 RepID=UPI00058CDD01|nr:amidase domain-containing protein [Candidatus Soleaferrea massiliensis]
MPTVLPYNRQRAFDYAEAWAYRRNPNYLDFSDLGGDCTNFASQCLYAGSGVMNYTPIYGWYYNSSSDRTASWTGVQYLYNFLTSNKTQGVFASDTTIDRMMIGDIIQLGNYSNEFYHSLVVTGVGNEPDESNILVSTHSFDAHQRRLSSYTYANIRFLHIEGVHKSW